MKCIKVFFIIRRTSLRDIWYTYTRLNQNYKKCHTILVLIDLQRIAFLRSYDSQSVPV